MSPATAGCRAAPSIEHVGRGRGSDVSGVAVATVAFSSVPLTGVGGGCRSAEGVTYRLQSRNGRRWCARQGAPRSVRSRRGADPPSQWSKRRPRRSSPEAWRLPGRPGTAPPPAHALALCLFLVAAQAVRATVYESAVCDFELYLRRACAMRIVGVGGWWWWWDLAQRLWSSGRLTSVDPMSRLRPYARRVHWFVCYEQGR